MASNHPRITATIDLRSGLIVVEAEMAEETPVVTDAEGVALSEEPVPASRPGLARCRVVSLADRRSA